MHAAQLLHELEDRGYLILEDAGDLRCFSSAPSGRIPRSTRLRLETHRSEILAELRRRRREPWDSNLAVELHTQVLAKIQRDIDQAHPDAPAPDWSTYTRAIQGAYEDQSMGQLRRALADYERAWHRYRTWTPDTDRRESIADWLTELERRYEVDDVAGLFNGVGKSAACVDGEPVIVARSLEPDPEIPKDVESLRRVHVNELLEVV